MNIQIETLINNMEKVIIGKRSVIIKTVAALLSGGHVLVEDVPGVGKTQLAAALAKSVDGKFNRIQFTPDIMPSDIMGFSMINQITREMEYREGAAMCNFLLADEINRASPKAQSSLLEVMEELQISVDGKTHPLPVPFMTLATQNPVETYGTYHLPEAQMDRFIMKLSMGYPSEDEEISILERKNNPLNTIGAVISLEDVVKLREDANKISVSPAVKKYLVSIITATRKSEYITLGASPRGSIALFKASKAIALINGRDFVTPDDIKWIACDVLSHRLILSAKGKSVFVTQEKAIEQIIKNIRVPVGE